VGNPWLDCWTRAKRGGRRVPLPCPLPSSLAEGEEGEEGASPRGGGSFVGPVESYGNSRDCGNVQCGDKPLLGE